MHSTKGTAQGRGQRDWFGLWGMACAWSNGNAWGVAWHGLVRLGAIWGHGLGVWLGGEAWGLALRAAWGRGVAWGRGLFLLRSTKVCCTFLGGGVCKSYS